MDERWDNDLSKRIKEVFDKYEDTSADEGWQLLREKYPEKAKRRIIGWLWLGSAAALLLFFTGILWYELGKGHKDQQLAHLKPHAKIDTVSRVVKNDNQGLQPDSATNGKQNNPAAATSSKNSIVKNLDLHPITAAPKRTNNAAAATPASNSALAQNKVVNHRKNKSVVEVNQSNISPALVVAKVESKQPATNPAVRPEVNPTNANNNVMASSVQPKNNQSAQNVMANNAKVDTSKKLNAADKQPGINMNQEQAKKQRSIFDNDNLVDNQKPDKKAPPNGKIVRLGVYAATYFNYAKGSNNQFNVGAGLSSDIRISENLKLSTGVSIGQNSLSYTNTNQVPATPSASASDFLAAASISSSPRALYTESTPQFRSYDASLVGLDIPLNLKYVFDPGKSNTYILAGVSSGTFISETYTYSFNNPSLFTANLAQVQNQSTNDNFSNFYFARTLNVAFGTGYMLGHNQLIIEPFLKYPLEGLGTQDLKFGAGGINLKFDFSVKKK